MLKKENLNRLRKNYKDNYLNKIKQRALNKVPLIDLIQDEDTKLTQDFNINIKTHSVTDQKATGYCWVYGGLNILREKVIKKCKLTNFELSNNYIAFYDKLERFNILLERLLSYKKENKKLYDREVSFLLQYGFNETGNFTDFANLIEKYGIVPQKVYPETYASSNTYEVNLILSRLLRKYYLDLEESSGNENALKDDYIEKAFGIITDIYGLPPEKFDFEYINKDEEHHIERNITPKEFYDKYIGSNLLEDYIEITSYEDEKFKYNNLYMELENSKISGKEGSTILNLPFKELENLILKQLKSDEPVYFLASTTYKRVDGIWIDTMERYGEIFGVDLKLDGNSILKTNGATNCHIMLFTGAHVIDNNVTKWKIENSWGPKLGNNGYYIATPDWVKTYVHKIVINKKHLTKQQLELLNKDIIKVDKWDSKF